MKKKVLALMLTAAMAVGLAACGGSSGSSAAAPASSAAASAAKEEAAASTATATTGGTEVQADGTVVTTYDAVAEVDPEVKDQLPHYDVLVTYVQFTDKLGSQFKSSIEYICNQLNCTPTFIEANPNGDEGLSTIQAALVNHYDFAIGVDMSEGGIKLYQDAGVPYVCSGAILSSDEQKEAVKKFDMFLGCVGVDDYGAMAEGAQTLYDLGCRNVMWNGLPVGMSGQHDERTKGFKETCEKLGMNLVTENLDYTTWADGISNAAATYPELDGIGCTALGEAVYNNIVAEGLQDSVKVCGIDISEGTGKAFEDGYLAYIAGGNYVTEQIAFVVAYNYVMDGTRIIEDNSENLLWNNINIHNVEEFNDYVKYLDGGVPAYTAQEVLEMTHWYNNDFTPADLIQAGKDFTLENVMERHADLF